MSSAQMKKNKREMDPEEAMRRKFRAKCRFRALGRMVMANTHWLMEAVDHYEGVEDVKRRVAQAVRGKAAKAKKKRLLTITDKALLNKPNSDRTEQEQKYIFRIIGGLKCFKRYPNHVKRKLAAVTYYKYFPPNTVVVKQDHEAHAMYFIVTGEVIISHTIFDELLQQYVSVDVDTMHAGDMFGEVSLLHNIPRTATCTTVGHCEMLALMKEDFKNVLQASVQAQWDEVRQAMTAFTYFDALDEVALREGCIVAKMKSYKVNDTILGDGFGIPNYVYFVLSGQCQMIDSLNVITTRHVGRTSYTLYDPYVPEQESEQDFDKKYFKDYKGKIIEPSEPSVKSKTSTLSSFKLARAPSNFKQLEKLLVDPPKKRKPSYVPSFSEPIAPTSNASSGTILKTDSEREIVTGQPSTMSRMILAPEIKKPPERESFDRTQPHYRTYFMQVCRYNPGSTFGFGENMRDRRIIALTPVDCMLMPKMWLLQKNTANIWSRIQHFLEKKIPTKQQLFKEYVTARRWQDYRDQLVGDVVARANAVNYTSMHDVPYSIRMEEMLDI